MFKKIYSFLNFDIFSNFYYFYSILNIANFKFYIKNLNVLKNIKDDKKYIKKFHAYNSTL